MKTNKLNTMEPLKDLAITTLQTLINACGAELENEALAVDILTGTFEKVVNYNKEVCNCEQPAKIKGADKCWRCKRELK